MNPQLPSSDLVPAPASPRHFAPPYRGKLTSCHTQAMITAYPEVFASLSPWLLDALTTVPFGLVYRPGDPNRLIDSYIDPDVGLDRALTTLEIGFDIRWWPTSVDPLVPLALLRQWCGVGPVVLGPLDMGRLPYLFHGELFSGIDHYIVALHVDDHAIWVCDPEGMPAARITPSELVAAWSANQVLEGRGGFTMRRIRSRQPAILTATSLSQTLRFAEDNLRACTAVTCGAAALGAIADDGDAILGNVSLLRGLSFVLPTRIQRSESIAHFMQQARASQCCHAPNTLWDAYAAALAAQIEVYARTFSLILAVEPTPLRLLHQAAKLETELTELLSAIKDYL